MNGYEVNGMTVSPIKSTSSSATLVKLGFIQPIITHVVIGFFIGVILFLSIILQENSLALSQLKIQDFVQCFESVDSLLM